MFPDTGKEGSNEVGLVDVNSSTLPTVNGLTDNYTSNEVVKDHLSVAKEEDFIKVKGRKKQGRRDQSSNSQQEINVGIGFRYKNKQHRFSLPVSNTAEKNVSSVSSSRIHSNLHHEVDNKGVRCIKDKDQIFSSPISRKTENFLPVTSGRTYSSVLRNQSKSQQYTNTSVVSRNAHNVSKDTMLDKSLMNCESLVSSETNLPTKVDVSVNNCFQNENLPSNEYNSNKYSDVAEESESSNTAYCESVVSNDSGCEITYDQTVPYMCEFPKNKIAQLIGQNGRYRNKIQNMSGVHFIVTQEIHPSNPDMHIIEMHGTGAQIERAKEIILSRFRDVSLTQYIREPFAPQLTENVFLHLPVCSSVLVVVSSIYDPSFFWVQQYGHPIYHKLQDLEKSMTDHFNTVTDVPAVLNPQIGSVVAVQGLKYGDNARWTRGEVMDIIPEEESVVVRYLDHGGDYVVPVTNIRPMRNEFFTVPFFASQCCLNDILPPGDGWSHEALEEFTRLCSGKTVLPTVQVVHRDGMCCFVSMKAYDSETETIVDVATVLAAKCLGFRAPLPATEFVPNIQL